MKIGLMVFLANERENNKPRPYDSIRAVAQQAESDGFDSIWLPDHFFYRNPNEPTRGIWECWTVLSAADRGTTPVSSHGTAVAQPRFEPIP